MTATLTESLTTSTISPVEFKRVIDQGDSVDLIDVRTPVEYLGRRIRVARNVPLDSLDARAIKAERDRSPGRPLYVVCQSGARARKACELLHAAGVYAVCVTGGTPACEAAGVPVHADTQVISLERQVRVGAGALVVTGVILAATGSQWFMIVPGFVGVGLVFAGVTDWCGMGLLLAKMPWNKQAHKHTS